MDVTADDQVVFVTALMRGAGAVPEGEKGDLQFRLTMRLRKIDSHGKVGHEYYSIPAT
jgi:ketosteroid isomerase-like protein